MFLGSPLFLRRLYNVIGLPRRFKRLRRRFAMEISPLEERVMLSRADQVVPMPANTVSPQQFQQNAVLYYFPQGNQASVPLKQITFYNNTGRVIFPFLEDANTRTATDNPNDHNPIYDPYDQYNQEYRGYIGYSVGKQNFLGLKPQQSITVNVPLVFWDSGRIGVSTDGKDLIPANAGAPNPFRWVANSARFTVPAISSSQNNGLVMWYHAPGKALGIANDAPSQLLEMTFRDQYLATLPTASLIPKSEKSFPLVNYDVSYVDSMVLPVAMEARNVPVPDQTVPPNKQSLKPFGWIGSKLKFAELQLALNAFTADGAGNGLGKYWNGKGYDKYYIPNEAFSGIKIPAGQNVVAQSPLSDVRSAYNNERYALVSGGTTNIALFDAATSVANSNVLTVPNIPGHIKVLKELKPGMVVSDEGQPVKSIQAGTVIKSIDIPKRQIILNKPALVGTDKNVYSFIRPVQDYVVSSLTDLWYGWADYYVSRMSSTPTQNAKGSTTAGSRVLSLNTPLPNLVAGMSVSGPGVPAGTTIFSVGSGGTSVNLSKVTAAATGNYTFAAPQPIPRSGEVAPLKLSFTSGKAQQNAVAFAQSLYNVMSAMSTIPTDKGSKASLSSQLMLNVLGCNIGKIPNVPPGSTIESDIRDQTKSILRGVADFLKTPEYVGTTRNWYPNPSVGTPGATVNGKAANFSVYNLNPFVWFVHVKLGLSGYGFSVDDDVADVGANGASQLDVAIGGTKGLQNPNEWTWGAPFGPLKEKAQAKNDTINQGGNPVKVGTIAGLSTATLAQLNNPDPSTGPGAIVTGPGVPAGTRVKLIDWGLRRVILDHLVTPQNSAAFYTFS